MILAGGNMAINGLWALHASSQVEKSFGDTLLFSSSNLDTWGWIYLIVGAVVVLAGILVFFRIAFGMWVGIIAALVQAFFAFFWIFSPYWPGALVIIALDLLVIYALGTTSAEPRVRLTGTVASSGRGIRRPSAVRFDRAATGLANRGFDGLAARMRPSSTGDPGPGAPLVALRNDLG